jgi:hypothetical protein
VCNLILVHMYSMHSDLPLNPGVTDVASSRFVHCQKPASLRRGSGLAGEEGSLLVHLSASPAPPPARICTSGAGGRGPVQECERGRGREGREGGPGAHGGGIVREGGGGECEREERKGAVGLQRPRNARSGMLNAFCSA